jgi:hypothetical protein
MNLVEQFDSHPVSSSRFYEADSADEDESLTVPKPPLHDVCLFFLDSLRFITFNFLFCFAQDDSIVEYEDEFGRIRTARRSEVPRNLRPESKDDDEDE